MFIGLYGPPGTPLIARHSKKLSAHELSLMSNIWQFFRSLATLPKMPLSSLAAKYLSSRPIELKISGYFLHIKSNLS